jgi:predicted nuclease of predicted toxin-antitoxin system
MAWAREHRHVVFTHDLDFGTLLALTRATGPSVVQVRTQDVLPANLEDVVVRAILSYQHELQKGALVTVDEARGKVRMLPLQSATES